MSKRYVKKPIPIEAMQWTGNNVDEISTFVGENIYFDSIDEVNLTGKRNIRIHTLEGEMSAHIGDYIVRGPYGEFYPVKREIFEKTYEEVK